MPPTRGPFNLRRAALLLAALLNLLVGTAGPVLHGREPVDPHLAGWSEDRREPASVPHEEQSCALCQVVQSRALPEPGHRPPVAAPASAAAAPSSLAIHPAPGRIRLQARAPPVSLV
ncbi:MAG TPA: hypothetical protein VEW03_04710 [Longimicrobiaceae bacterium]|nr:hypothetical protein [Longimicrobiaceae bacterium]